MPVQRLEFDQLPRTLTDRLQARVKRLGYLGEFFKCTAHQPEALAAFLDFTEAGKGALDKRLVEVIALTAAGWVGNAYERNQHERLSVRLGFGRDWVAAVNRLQPDFESALSPQERRMQQLVLVILETRGKNAGTLFEQAVAELGQASAIAVLMVIGRYVTHGLIVNTLALAPPVPSIFEDGFAG
jgi:alkylhydroperoxidase family enzyme